MKNVKTVLAAGVLAASSAMIAAPAAAEGAVDASVNLTNLYLFRGVDAGDGSAAVQGDITYSQAGFSASIWGSSTGSSDGGEYDIILGWNGEFEGVSVGVGVINYIYPGIDSSDSVGDLSEGYVTLGFGGVEAAYYDNVAGDNGYRYYSLGYSCDKWSVLAGQTDREDGADSDFTHFDVTYSITDNLSFTASKIIDDDASGTQEDDTLFVLNYSLPIEIK